MKKTVETIILDQKREQFRGKILQILTGKIFLNLNKIAEEVFSEKLSEKEALEFFISLDWINVEIWSDLGMDSLDQVELVMECEREFSLSIPDNEAEKVLTLGDLETLLMSKL